MKDEISNTMNDFPLRPESESAITNRQSAIHNPQSAMDSSFLLPPSSLPASQPYTDSLWEEYAEIDIADVVVDIDAPDLQSSYSYRVPEVLQNTLVAGACVHIPFAGRETLGYVLARRKLPSNDPLCGKLKTIIGIVEDAITINSEQLHLIQWMSQRYVCDLLDALRCVAPANLGARVATIARLADTNYRGADVGASIPQAHVLETLRALDGEAEVDALREAAHLPNFAGAYAALLKKGLLIESRTIVRAKTVGKVRKAYTLGAAAVALTQGGSVGNRSPQQQRILNELVQRARHNEGPVPGDELVRISQASPASLRGLVDKGLVQAHEITVRRAPVHAQGERTIPPPLTPGQQNATDKLRACLESGDTQTVLLFGVTASGKTEVYLNSIAHTLEQGRSAIVLVPEIALTTQIVDTFVGRFGEQVAVLHSKLSEGERHDEWRRMQAGKARIVVGARSAIFAPVQNVGLIVMDEEHEASYKQENTPRYNAKDLAMERARLSRATLILGSATPSLESYFATQQRKGEKEKRRKGEINVFSPEMTLQQTKSESLNSVEEPRVQYEQGRDASPFLLFSSSPFLLEMPDRIDNRPLPRVEVVDLREEFKKQKALFSERLIAAMMERLKKKQQTILFLNRRGYAQFVLCRDCGWTAKCPNCAVSLAYHNYERALKCHHCDYNGRVPLKCLDCGGMKVKSFGIGTEKVEEEVLRVFPTARVARMDRDTTSQKGAHTRIMRAFRQGESDILIGTQMVAKGLDFPNVTLVGVISADTAINMPDFRAAERTFQLLTQVAGRAGRGNTPGEVIIQTFSPDHYAVQAAIQHDYARFYKQEILFRQELKYPPYSRFVNLICADEIEAKAQARSNVLVVALERLNPPDVEIIGPSPAPLARLKNQYRFHVALRAPVDYPLSELVRSAIACLAPADRLGLYVDIDPLSMA